jgi:hypothetical protein
MERAALVVARSGGGRGVLAGEASEDGDVFVHASDSTA